MTIRTVIDAAVAKVPENTAVAFKRNSVWVRRTYREFGERVAQVAEGFARLGIEPKRDFVVLVLENGPEWVEIYSALAGTGVTVVPVDPKLRGPEIAYLLQDSRATAVVASEALADTLAAILPTAPAVRCVVLVGGTAEPPTIAGRRTEAYATWVAASPVPAQGGRYATCRPAGSDIASVIYTSGTTGKPKGAMLTHTNFCSDAVGALDVINNVTPRDSFLVVLPLFHSFAFLTNYVVPLCHGCSIYFVESLRTVGEDAKALSPTILMAVPLLVEKMYGKINDKLKHNKLAQTLIRCGLGRLVGAKVRRQLGGKLRLVIVGGAPCPVQVLWGFRKLGIGIVEGYGLTEASPVVSLSRIDDARPGTIGYKLPNIDIRIADPDAQGVGELQIRGPIVMKGYYHNPTATEEVFDGEWLCSGDLASLDADGYITIRGRKKALIINREGKNIYPEEVEQAIAIDTRIYDVVVVGYSERGEVGEKVGAIIVPDLDLITAQRKGHTPSWGETEALLRQIVAEQCRCLADYKHPRKLDFRREPLERTSTQKVRRHIYQNQLDVK